MSSRRGGASTRILSSCCSVCCALSPAVALYKCRSLIERVCSLRSLFSVRLLRCAEACEFTCSCKRTQFHSRPGHCFSVSVSRSQHVHGFNRVTSLHHVAFEYNRLVEEWIQLEKCAENPAFHYYHLSISLPCPLLSLFFFLLLSF